MTCIVGVVSGKRIVIGGDSAAWQSGSLSLSVREDRKVFRNGEFIMGFTSSFRMGQLLAYSLSAPKPREECDLMRYMVTDFVDAVRTCFKTGGFAQTHDAAERGGTFLVGFRGRLFTIEGDYQVAEHPVGYHAVGCGDMIALGSLHATAGLIKDPQKRAQRALTAAEAFSAGVRGPFNFETLEGGK